MGDTGKGSVVGIERQWETQGRAAEDARKGSGDALEGSIRTLWKRQRKSTAFASLIVASAAVACSAGLPCPLPRTPRALLFC